MGLAGSLERAGGTGRLEAVGTVGARSRANDRPDHVERNKAAWERWAPAYAAGAHEAWADPEPRWGIWGAPESNLRLLKGLRQNAQILELGCGTASLLAALKRVGYRPVGVDIARPLLEVAADLERTYGVSFALLCANAERVPYDDRTFDCVISEYGASLWCDPYRWIPEAHRLLRASGRLIFITNSPLLMACTPPAGGRAGEQLVRDYFTEERVEFPGDDAVEFHLTHGDWVRLLRDTGFLIENLIEIRPPEGATARFDFADAEWAERWPSEDIWIARKAPARRPRKPAPQDDAGS